MKKQLLLLILAGISMTNGCSCSSKKPVNSSAQPQSQAEVVTTASGLKYSTLKAAPEGAPHPKKGQHVAVHYTGWLDENGKPGKKFDSSLDRGVPFSFVIGAGQVIKGWDEGVMSMKVGEKRRLIIPSNLGYGPNGFPGAIPGGATLIFDVELLGVE